MISFWANINILENICSQYFLTEIGYHKGLINIIFIFNIIIIIFMIITTYTLSKKNSMKIGMDPQMGLTHRIESVKTLSCIFHFYSNILLLITLIVYLIFFLSLFTKTHVMTMMIIIVMSVMKFYILHFMNYISWNVYLWLKYKIKMLD